MIRQLTEFDHEICFSLLKTKPAENVFIIGDIENYGYNQDFQKLWGEFNDEGELIAVLLKFRENYIPFAIDTYDAEGFAAIIKSDASFKNMSGLKEITEQIEPFLIDSLVWKKQTYYAKCTEIRHSDREIDLSIVEEAVPEDAEAIVELLSSIPEFKDSIYTVDRTKTSLIDGSKRSFFIKEDNQIVSIASTTAENTFSAMIVGVATLEDRKKKGYATKCMLKLCGKLVKEGKELCLFYDNPKAGSIYKRIGFEDIGDWMMYRYK